MKNHVFQRSVQKSLEECPTCVGIVEITKHVFFTCPGFRETALDLKIKPDNLTEAILASVDGWKVTTTFATKVLQDLRQEEEKRTEIKKTTEEKK